MISLKKQTTVVNVIMTTKRTRQMNNKKLPIPLWNQESTIIYF
ncbi:unknown [Prevotella sp. CAG:1124]|nr:unknown [Prevotella sp. CAG:1124]